MPTVTPFLWFDDNAGAAIDRYQEVFPDTRVLSRQDGPNGELFLAEIELLGQPLVLMNGGPHHRLSPAFSLSLPVPDQAEMDRISDALIEGGGEQGNCGWLVDAFGLSWQVIPDSLDRLLGDPERGSAVRAAMMQMHRIDLAALQRAYDGQ